MRREGGGRRTARELHEVYGLVITLDRSLAIKTKRPAGVF